MLRKLALILTLDSSLNLPAAESADAMPNPTEQDVKSLFGQRLSNGCRAENLQLLAIAFDQHSRNSPTLEEEIGIPYIATAGSGYWIRLCQQEQPNPNLDMLVNNARLLIYAQEPSVTDDLRLEASTRLLTVASACGYWPAQVWLSGSYRCGARVESPFQ